MATARKSARKPAVKANSRRLLAIAELSALDAVVQFAKIALKEAKRVRRLAHMDLAEGLDIQAKPAKKVAKKAAKKKAKPVKK